MIEKEWITLIGTLSGVIVGGVITNIVKFFEIRYQKNQENLKIKLAKIEDLHQMLSDYVAELPEYGTNVLISKANTEIILGPKDYADVTKLLYKPLSKPHTLLCLYAPELKPKWQELSFTLQNLNAFCLDYFKNDIPGENILDFNQAVVDKLTEILELLETKRMFLSGEK